MVHICIYLRVTRTTRVRTHLEFLTSRVNTYLEYLISRVTRVNTHLEYLVPGVAGGQPEEGEHGGSKGQEVGMWVLLTQRIAAAAKQVHAQDGIDEEHEEQQAAHVEDGGKGADEGVEERPQAPVPSTAES